MMRMGQDESARRMFDRAFDELEQRCLRDARDLRRFKAMIWGKVKTYHNITHLEYDECVQVILQIVDKGCQSFYRTQHEELLKYCQPSEGDAPKRPSRASMSTFMYGHVIKKFNSLMSAFFAPIRTFEAGRIRTDITEVVGIDTKGHVAKALSEGKIRLPKGVTLTVGEDKKIIKTSPGTIGLQRHDIHEPGCPLLEYTEDSYKKRPDLMAQLTEFMEEHRGVIQVLVSLGETERCPPHLVDEVGDIAGVMGISVGDFTKAVRGLFGQDQYLQNV